MFKEASYILALVSTCMIYVSYRILFSDPNSYMLFIIPTSWIQSLLTLAILAKFWMLGIAPALIAYISSDDSDKWEPLPVPPTLFIAKLLVQITDGARELVNRFTPAPFVLLHNSQVMLLSVATGWAAKRNIAEYLKESKTIEELASALQIDNIDHLERVMKFLVFNRVFAFDGERFRNNRLSGVLCDDHPCSVRALFIHFYTDEVPALRHFDQIFTKDKTLFELEFGKSLFDYFDDHEEKRVNFGKAMVSVSNFSDKALVEDYPFKDLHGFTVVDIGGGVGGFLSSILDANPSLNGVLFDREGTINDARSLWSGYSDSLQSRISFEFGDFFQSVPTPATQFPTGTLLLLRFILHDWSDEMALKILTNAVDAVRRSKNVNNRVLVVDHIYTGPLQAGMDMLMLLFLHGKERTEMQWHEIAHKAGGRITRMIPTRAHYNFIEIEPVDE